MKNALEIMQFIAYSSNTEVSKVSSWGSVKKESINGLNRAIRVLWNSKEWNFRREIKKKTINATKSVISMPRCIFAKNGITIDRSVLSYDKDIPFYTDATGQPDKYYVDNKDRIHFYPTPDKDYTVILETYNTYPVLDSIGSEKAEFNSSSDTINITERLENLFIDCLNYFCNEILNGDPTDEEYQEHKLRHSEVYKLLEKADMYGLDNDDNKGFKMPWQQ